MILLSDLFHDACALSWSFGHWDIDNLISSKLTFDNDNDANVAKDDDANLLSDSNSVCSSDDDGYREEELEHELEVLLEQAKEEEERDAIDEWSEQKFEPLDWSSVVNINDTPTKITLSISKADSIRVKTYAAAHDTTVSALLRKWINENCV